MHVCRKENIIDTGLGREEAAGRKGVRGVPRMRDVGVGVTGEGDAGTGGV